MNLRFLSPVAAGVCLSAFLLVAASFAQSSSTANASSPAARVYVTYYTQQNMQLTNPQIRGYTADSSGRLTPIPGGPWPGIAEATTGSYLFALNQNGTDVYSYSVGAGGALTKVDTYRIANRAPSGCADYEYFGSVILDHTGSTLYASGDFASSGGGAGTCTNNSVTQSYKINKTNGSLTFLGMIDNTNCGVPQTFSGNNAFAFGFTSNDYNALNRQSNGMLVCGTSTPGEPAGAGGVTYSAGTEAADPLDHVAVVAQPQESGHSTLLESYTIQPNGGLTTTNTVQNSAKASSFNVWDLKMSPAGNLLAVSDDAGVRVYHFNGANPIKAYTPNLTSDASGSMFWDKANHLYVSGYDKLYVFTVTPTGYAQATGSPYAIPYIGSIVVRAM